MLAPSWSAKLAAAPLGHLARLIDLQGDAQGIIYQTSGRKLFVHQSSQSRALPFQKDISCFEVYSQHDQSVVVAYLSNNVLSAYDVLNNVEKFTHEFELAELLHFTGTSLLVAGASTLYCLDLAGQ